MQQYSILQPTHREVPNSEATQLDANTLLLGSTILIVPLLITAGATLHKKYRSAVLRRRIVALEKIWGLELFRDA